MKCTNLYSDTTLKTLNYFLIFLPILLISGPFLSDLAVSVLTIFSLFYLRNKKFFTNYFFLVFIIFWVLILLSSSFSENKLLSFKSSIFYFRFCLFSLFVWWLIENDKKILKKIYIILLFCFLAIILDSFFQYFNGSNIFNFEVVTRDRISSFFRDELKMGGFLMRLFPLLIGLTFFFYKKKHEKFLIPLIIFIFLTNITIFMSGERTSFILFNLTIILFLIFLNDIKKIKIIIFLIYCLSLILVFSIDTPFKKRIVNLTIEQIEIDKELKPKYIFSKQYHEHYLSAWKMFKDNILIGVGPKNFRVKCKDEKYNFSKLTCSTHPHNFPIQLLSEVGFFGFLIYLTINIIVWYNLFKNLFFKIIYKKKTFNNFQISLLIGIAILIWPLSPNGNIFNNWLSIILYYPVGFLLWELRKSKKMYLKSFKR